MQIHTETLASGYCRLINAELPTQGRVPFAEKRSIHDEFERSER